ncbi:hypothetical protein AHAS_Ahas20G0242900 [Arachis hypogaea]
MAEFPAASKATRQQQRGMRASDLGGDYATLARQRRRGCFATALLCHAKENHELFADVGSTVLCQ